MAQCFPLSWLVDPIGDEGGILRSCLRAGASELTEHPVGLQSEVCGSQADHGAVAALSPRRALGHYARAHRVKHHVARQPRQVDIPFYENGFEPAPKQVSLKAIAPF